MKGKYPRARRSVGSRSDCRNPSEGGGVRARTMPLAQLDTDHRLQTSVATFAARTEPVTRDAGPHLAAEEQAAAAFERAAKCQTRWPMQAPMSRRSPGTSLCKRGGRSLGNAGSLGPVSEGVQCMGDENPDAQNNKK
jgi:hypothetical protein